MQSYQSYRIMSNKNHDSM